MKKYGALFLITLVALTVTVSADAIFVENHSFEEPGVDKPTWDLVPGWDSTNDALGGAEQGWGPTDGDYTAFMEIGCQAYNLTDHLIGAGTEYTLTFDMRKTWAGADTTVDLFYDDEGTRVPMASLLVEFPAGDTTDMEEYTVTATSNDVPGSIGKPIGIQITCGEVGPAGGGWIGFDNIRLDATSLNVVPIHPIPGSALVGIDDDLSWSVKDNWNVDVYFQADDPNFTGVQPVVVDTADTTYDPGTMVNETTYYWRLDAYEPNSLGTDFIVHTGPVWGFTIAPATPTITLGFKTQTVALGSTVELTIEGSNIDSCVWYKDDVIIPGQTGTTLTIEAAQVTDEGYYQCEAINTAGSDTSTVERLLTKRLIGWWKLDGNLNDSIKDAFGDAPAHPGTAPLGDPNYVVLGVDGSAIDLYADGKIVTIDDSAEYFNFYTQGQTVSVWIKTNTSTWDGVISKHRRVDPWAGWLIDVNDGRAHYTIREVHGDMWGTDDDGDMFDGDWHLVTAVMDPVTNTSRIYIDGAFDDESDEYAMGDIVVTQEPVVFGAETADTTVNQILYTGQLDDVKIWSYPLDDITIALLYTDYNPGSGVCVGNPQFDITGPDGVPDCRVDLYELSIWAQSWLECNIVPTCIP